MRDGKRFGRLKSWWPVYRSGLGGESCAPVHLFVYNWDDAASVEADLSPVVDSGASYVIHSVYDVYGAPVVQGIYDGSAVAVPMGTVAPPQPHGLDGYIETSEDPGASFGAFVVTHTPCLP